MMSTCWAAEPVPIELQGIGVTEHLSAQVPLNVQFTDEEGKSVALQDFFDGAHPVILALVYYECPNLCHFLLNGFTESLKKMPWTAGEEFTIVTVSINPRENAELARGKRDAHIAAYGRPSAARGWHFLTGNAEAIAALAASVGFQYRFDAAQQQYAHAAVLTVLTPRGIISRYLYGIEFAPRDLKLALVEAGEGKIGTLVDRLLLFCYHYDPKGRVYALYALNLMKGAAALTVFSLIGVVWRMARRTKIS